MLDREWGRKIMWKRRNKKRKIRITNAILSMLSLKSQLYADARVKSLKHSLIMT